MSTERILIHGTTAQRMGTTPAQGQIGSDDDEGRVYLGDSATPGGIGMARKDELPSASRLLPVPVAGDVGKVPVVNETEDGFDLVDGGGSAANVTYDNAASGLAAATVQAALDELAGGAGSALPLPTLSNSSGDLTNDIDFSDGEALDSTGAIVIPCAAMTKRLDANWSAGTGNGGRYSGAAIADTTYHCWAICKANGADPDYYFDPSANAATVLAHVQAETGGASYAHVRRIGAIIREAGVIVIFKQDGDLFMRALKADYIGVVNPGTGAQTITLAVPTGIRLCAVLSLSFALSSTTAETYAMLVSDLSLPAFAPTSSMADIVMATQEEDGVYRASGSASVMTNTSGQIRAQQLATNAGLVQNIVVRGWIDRRK